MEILKKATVSQKKRRGQVGKAYEDVRGAEKPGRLPAAIEISE
jgi:hypothetical protein